MSTPFYDLASLVVVPSGYKASKVYAQKPLTTDGQLTFSRASTATRVNASGLIETVSSNVPRLDYLGSTCPKLLLEPSRTNAFPFSEAVSSWYEPDDGVTITSNTTDTLSPDGTNNATKVTIVGGSQRNYQITSSTAGAGTLSLFVKAGTGNSILLLTSSGSLICSYNLSTQVATPTTGTGTITSYGNGWYRLTVSGTIGNNEVVQVVYSGLAGITFYIWGAMIENGAYATSYVKTAGAAVTRLADTYQKGGFGNTSTAGTFFCEFVATRITSDNGMYLYGMGVGTTDTLGSSYATNTGSLSIIANGPTLQGRNNGYGTNLFSLTPTAGATVKIAIRYDGTNVVAFVNGVKQTVYTDNAVGVKNFIRVNNGEQSSHATKQLLFFPTALTDAQAIELTTL